MSKYIRGEIIKIEDSYTVLLNITSEDGVEEDMEFIVYEEGEEIIDASGNILGKIEFPIATVKIINVSSKFSVAESNKYYYDPGDYDCEPDYDYDPTDEYKYQVVIAEVPGAEKEKTEQNPIKSGDIALRDKIKRHMGRKVRVGDLVRSKKSIT